MGEKKYRSFEDAKKFARELGLQGEKEWVNFVNSGTKPIDIPERPQMAYKRNWDSWSDFLGNDLDGTWFRHGMLFRNKDDVAKLRKTTRDLSNYKKALAEFDWANMRLADKVPKTRFDPKSGSTKNRPNKNQRDKLKAEKREELAKRIQSAITKLEQISQKLTEEPGSSPKNPILARKKLTSQDYQKIHNKSEKLRAENDWVGLYDLTKDLVKKPTMEIEPDVLNFDQAIITSDHIDALLNLAKTREALQYGKYLLRAVREDENLLGMAWFQLGQIYYKLNKIKDALNAYKTALSYGDESGINTDGTTWYNIAACHARLEHSRKACFSLIAALAYDDEPEITLLDISDDKDFDLIRGSELFEALITTPYSELF